MYSKNYKDELLYKNIHLTKRSDHVEYKGIYQGFLEDSTVRLSVSREGKLAADFQFEDGPVYIGRQMGSQVFLPDRAVSRQHAVIYKSETNQWVIEDLDSANKTFLNKNAIHKSEFKDGDTISIGIFTLQVHIDEDKPADTAIDIDDNTPEEKPIHLDDTLAEIMPEIHTVIRNPDSKSAEMIRIPSKRIKDFSKASQAICATVNLRQLHKELLQILLRQFAATNVWAALREEPDEAMDCEGGRMITSESIELSQLAAQKALADAMGKSKYVLVPKLPREVSKDNIRSAIVAPILKDGKSYGVLYAENSIQHGHYGLTDLDYLILITIQAAAMIENF